MGNTAQKEPERVSEKRNKLLEKTYLDDTFADAPDFSEAAAKETGVIRVACVPMTLHAGVSSFISVLHGKYPIWGASGSTAIRGEEKKICFNHKGINVVLLCYCPYNTGFSKPVSVDDTTGLVADNRIPSDWFTLSLEPEKPGTKEEEERKEARVVSPPILSGSFKGCKENARGFLKRRGGRTSHPFGTSKIPILLLRLKKDLDVLDMLDGRYNPQVASPDYVAGLLGPLSPGVVGHHAISAFATRSVRHKSKVQSEETKKGTKVTKKRKKASEEQCCKEKRIREEEEETKPKDQLEPVKGDTGIPELMDAVARLGVAHYAETAAAWRVFEQELAEEERAHIADLCSPKNLVEIATCLGSRKTTEALDVKCALLFGSRLYNNSFSTPEDQYSKQNEKERGEEEEEEEESDEEQSQKKVVSGTDAAPGGTSSFLAEGSFAHAGPDYDMLLIVPQTCKDLQESDTTIEWFITRGWFSYDTAYASDKCIIKEIFCFTLFVIGDHTWKKLCKKGVPLAYELSNLPSEYVWYGSLPHRAEFAKRRDKDDIIQQFLDAAKALWTAANGEMTNLKENIRLQAEMEDNKCKKKKKKKKKKRKKKGKEEQPKDQALMDFWLKGDTDLMQRIYRAEKRLVHSLRLLSFGTQLASSEVGRITDYKCMEKLQHRLCIIARVFTNSEETYHQRYDQYLRQSLAPVVRTSYTVSKGKAVSRDQWSAEKQDLWTCQYRKMRSELIECFSEGTKEEKRKKESEFYRMYVGLFSSTLNTAKGEEGELSAVPEIPSELVYHILLLIRCPEVYRAMSLVCKKWNSVVDSRPFAEALCKENRYPTCVPDVRKWKADVAWFNKGGQYGGPGPGRPQLYSLPLLPPAMVYKLSTRMADFGLEYICFYCKKSVVESSETGLTALERSWAVFNLKGFGRHHHREWKWECRIDARNRRPECMYRLRWKSGVEALTLCCECQASTNWGKVSNYGSGTVFFWGVLKLHSKEKRRGEEEAGKEGSLLLPEPNAGKPEGKPSLRRRFRHYLPPEGTQCTHNGCFSGLYPGNYLLDKNSKYKITLLVCANGHFIGFTSGAGRG